MSMILHLVKLPIELGERVIATPDLLNQIWGVVDIVDADVAALNENADKFTEDYLHRGRALIEKPGQFPWMEKAMNGTGNEIAFEFGYGPGFVITPTECSQIATALVDEGWWRPTDEVTTIAQAIAAFYTTAATETRMIIGGIN